MITNTEDYFTMGCGRCERFATADCSARLWKDGLSELRRICRASGLIEMVKWGHPCYVHKGRNIAIIGAFRGAFRLSFFNSALLTDSEAVLEKQGPNTRHPDMIRFVDSSKIRDLEPVILAYLREAMGFAEAGIRPPKEEGDIELPDELVDALDCDPELAEAFRQLTPGRKRSYVINLNGARKAETRMSRIAGFRDRILAGRGATEL